MKIAYIVADKLDKEHGVAKKIKSQIKLWEANGHDVTLFYFSNAELTFSLKDIKSKQIKHRNRIEFIFSLNGKKEIQKFKPDIVYFRYYLFSFSFNLILKKFKSIIEINSNDIEESKISYTKLMRLYLLFTRKLLLIKANAFITVTEELQTLVRKYSRNIYTIANGIDGPFNKKTVVSSNTKFNAIFIGSPNQLWHGVDKLIEIAKKIPECNFHIIGIEKVNNAPKNIIQYGYMNESDYIDILQNCDVGIGTLALHRNNMNEASPLKVREYLKNGLPIIIGYKDSDFMNRNIPFILEIPNEENNVKDNIDKIKNFILSSKSLTINQKDVENIFSKLKETKRLELFNYIIKK